jgi:tripeptide aminopeptidase
MQSLLDRFCRYVQIDTQAREEAGTYPSSPGQLELGKLLVQELRALGLSGAVADEHGIVLATLPATTPQPAPTIALLAHLDTSPETSGQHVRPIVHRNYQSQDLILPGDPSQVLRVADNPELAQLLGRTIITTDGTTLLGADDRPASPSSWRRPPISWRTRTSRMAPFGFASRVTWRSAASSIISI